MHEGNFSRKLRHELPADEQERIMQIIADIAKEAANGSTNEND